MRYGLIRKKDDVSRVSFYWFDEHILGLIRSPNSKPYSALLYLDVQTKKSFIVPVDIAKAYSEHGYIRRPSTNTFTMSMQSLTGDKDCDIQRELYHSGIQLQKQPFLKDIVKTFPFEKFRDYANNCHTKEWSKPSKLSFHMNNHLSSNAWVPYRY